MEDISTQEAAQALNILATRVVEREQDLAQYSPTNLPQSFDETEDSESPIYDTFYQSGKSKAILSMTNFTGPEFHRIWNYFAEYVTQRWNSGRGKKSTHKPKDVFFMLLTVCKHAGQWDFLARMFNMKGPTFERTIMKMLDCVHDLAYTKLVTDKLDFWTMSKLVERKHEFKTFKFAKYATDVTFQQCNRPSGNVDEGKRYYSGKHKLYGYKVEVSVLPNGFAVGCSDHSPGSVADIDIFYKHIYFHKIAAEKKDDDNGIIDVGTLVEVFPDLWAVLVDKGYQGLAEAFRAIHPHKKPRNGFLTTDQEAYNKKVASDRIIVENFFGRLCTLWTLMSNKWRWNESCYDTFFRFCVALTNVHIAMHPLRDEDGTAHRRLQVRTFTIGDSIVAKRKRTQEKYRAKRKMRLALQFNRDSDSDGDTLDPNQY